MANKSTRKGTLEPLKTTEKETLEQISYTTYFKTSISNFKQDFRNNWNIYHNGDYSDRIAKLFLIVSSPIALAHAFVFPSYYKRENQDEL